MLEDAPSAPRAQIAGVGMAVPSRRVTNAELAARLGVDEEWIAKRTGTSERPWAQDGERLSELAAAAGRDALTAAGVAAIDLDLLLVATTTADELTPNAAPVVAGLLGASRAGCFDVGSACTGWLAALATATAQIESGRARSALVIGADLLSRFLDLDDRDTAVLFADGAGAAIVRATEDQDRAIGPVLLRSDARGGSLIRLERSGRIQMDGRETFRAAVESLSGVSEEAVAACGLRLTDIDLFVYHQANSRILQAVGRRLQLDERRVIDYVGRFANSSTATLPIALTVAHAEGWLAAGNRVLLGAFGGGFTWGATVLGWAAS